MKIKDNNIEYNNNIEYIETITDIVFVPWVSIYGIDISPLYFNSFTLYIYQYKSIEKLINQYKFNP